MQEVQVHRCYGNSAYCSVAYTLRAVLARSMQRIRMHARGRGGHARSPSRLRETVPPPPGRPPFRLRPSAAAARAFPGLAHAVASASAFPAPKPRQILQPPRFSDRNLPRTDLIKVKNHINISCVSCVFVGINESLLHFSSIILQAVSI